jgi:hypothetical protein
MIFAPSLDPKKRKSATNPTKVFFLEKMGKVVIF